MERIDGNLYDTRLYQQPYTPKGEKEETHHGN
jgi:hypothetical protein